MGSVPLSWAVSGPVLIETGEANVLIRNDLICHALGMIMMQKFATSVDRECDEMEIQLVVDNSPLGSHAQNTEECPIIWQRPVAVPPR